MHRNNRNVVNYLQAKRLSNSLQNWRVMALNYYKPNEMLKLLLKTNRDMLTREKRVNINTSLKLFGALDLPFRLQLWRHLGYLEGKYKKTTKLRVWRSVKRAHLSLLNRTITHPSPFQQIFNNGRIWYWHSTVLALLKYCSCITLHSKWARGFMSGLPAGNIEGRLSEKAVWVFNGTSSPLKHWTLTDMSYSVMYAGISSWSLDMTL